MRRVVTFFVLAYALTWAGWAPLVASSLGWTDTQFTPYLHLFASLGPALAAVVMARAEGRASLRRLASRLTLAPPRWIAAAICAPVALYLVAAGVLALLGYGVDLGATGTSAEYPQLGIGTYVVANIFFYGVGEELGWRGFALPRLQRSMSATTASLVVALGWALWHLPLFAFAGMSSMGLGAATGWLVSIVAGSFLMSALFNASGGSVLVVALFHGTLDILMTSPTGGPLQTVMGALLTIAGLTVPFRFGRANLAPRPRVVDTI
jgi:membrane protease YdiL (CAAX protease family)